MSERATRPVTAAPAESARRSGALVARLFHRLLAATFCAAWLSLGRQLDVLVGSHGLLPAAGYLADARAHGLGWLTLPTVFWLDASDLALRGGIWLGVALSAAAFLGWRPRLCTGIATALYLSYATVAQSFLSFQWDNLLLECGALAVLLPTDRPAPWVHALFRLLLFKLYWESGIAKWQSPLGDWQDGSAMVWYYETAPLPTWIGWYAHHLPQWWHHFESRAVLLLELAGPLLVFGPRRARLWLFAAFGAFQLANVATANYGFFVYLALILQVFLLADADLQRVLDRLPTRGRIARSGAPARAAPAELRPALAVLVTAIYVGISAGDALATFAPGYAPASLYALLRRVAPWRLVNTYHLFGQVTRERIEPQFAVESDGQWTELMLWYKPGDVQRAPPIVAPHQPRVDFQLWFYGLSFTRGTPGYVGALLERLCRDPQAVQPLFVPALPARRTAVKILFWRYRFSDPQTRASTTAWWERELVVETRPMSCAPAR
ncbi:MAG: lipase maturation factor family protein [Candidatus Binatia bacterium]